ncbi:MAG: hypothetical protein M3177_03335 [Pseudomonadota bacterium]|nr:hypothetical protein [Pseudomonadota bacterium]
MPRSAWRHSLSAGLLTLLVAAPVRSQPEADRQIPAELLMPDQEAQSFIAALEADPLEGEELDALPAEAMEPMEPFLTAMFERGERVENWQQIGVDIERIVAAREGGLAGNMTEATNPFGVQRTYFTDRPLSSILPPQLRLLARYGPTVAGEGVRLEIANVGPRTLLVMRARYQRQGLARCQVMTETFLYSDPSIAATQADMGSVMLGLVFARRTDALGLCFTVEEREPERYVYRSFDRAGHRLPQLDAGQPPLRIVPFAPVPAAAPQG